MTQIDFKDKEQEGVEELRHLLKGTMSPELYADTNMFLRFLRARNHDISAAENMLRNHINWRKLNRVDSILQWYIPHEASRRFIPFTRIGIDHEGSPITYSTFGALDAKGLIKTIKITECLHFFVNLLESDIFVMKEQSAKLNRNVDKWIHVLNFENFPLTLATHKPTLEAASKMLSMYEGNYPEHLKCAMIINASWYFQIAFTFVKPLITGQTLNKVKIYGKDGWQEELQKIMDVNEIPAFLGGNKTDPDGDPMCRTFINHGGVVPECLYALNRRVSLSGQPKVKKISINRLSKVQIELHVLYPGAEIEWEFETKGKDIGFALLYKESKYSSKEPIEVFPRQRVDTSIASESGVFKSEKAGNYYLEFDNTYSWIQSKEVYYRVNVINPHQQSNGA